MITEIEILKQQESELMNQLRQNRIRQMELNQIEFIKTNKLNIGNLVEWRDKDVHKKGIISGLAYAGTTPYTYNVNLIKPDGKIDTKEVEIKHRLIKYVKVVKN